MTTPHVIYDNIVNDIMSSFSFSIAPPKSNNIQGKSFDEVLDEVTSNTALFEVDESTVLNLYDNSILKMSGTDADRIKIAISTASKKYNIDENLIKAVIQQESDYNQYCVSSAGAVGLMQLMPVTAETVGVTDRYDIEQNIDGGTHYLRKMLDRFNGDLELALAGYNAGPNAVAKYGGIPPYKETQNYVPKVLSYMEQYASGILAI